MPIPKRTMLLGSATLILTGIFTTPRARADDDFHMPYQRVAAMSPEQFVAVYYRTIGSYNNVAFRSGIQYYTDSLQKRIKLRARRLGSTDRAKFMRFERAMSHWVDYYLQWYDTHTGTSWIVDLDDSEIRIAQVFDSLAGDMNGSGEHVHKESLALVRELSTLETEIQVPTGVDEPDYAATHSLQETVKKMTTATTELKPAYLSLHIDGDAALVGFFEHIRKTIKV